MVYVVTNGTVYYSEEDGQFLTEKYDTSTPIEFFWDEVEENDYITFSNFTYRNPTAASAEVVGYIEYADDKIVDFQSLGNNVTLAAETPVTFTVKVKSVERISYGYRITLYGEPVPLNKVLDGHAVGFFKDKIIGGIGTAVRNNNNRFYGADEDGDGQPGLVPKPIKSTNDDTKYLKGDGTWSTPPNTTYSNFTGTDGSSAGAAGLVPAPATTDAGKFLKADGTWAVAGGAGGGVITLTSADYNWNYSTRTATDPNCIAPWLLDAGLYAYSEGVMVANTPYSAVDDEARVLLVSNAYGSSGSSLRKCIYRFDASFNQVDSNMFIRVNGEWTANGFFESFLKYSEVQSYLDQKIAVVSNTVPDEGYSGEDGQLLISRDGTNAPRLFICGGSEWDDVEQQQVYYWYEIPVNAITPSNN